MSRQSWVFVRVVLQSEVKKNMSESQIVTPIKRRGRPSSVHNGMKKCGLCGMVKPITVFARHGKNFRSYCNPCNVEYQREYMREYTIRNKEKVLRWQRNFKRLHKKELNARYMEKYRTNLEFRRHTIRVNCISRNRNRPRRVDNTFQAYFEVLMLREEYEKRGKKI